MTRFIYLTDTHLDAVAGQGYHQQPRYADRLPMLLSALDAWIAVDARRTDRDPITFVLHGGDMVDRATPETLRRARETFRLRVPVYLSLGNHDLTAPAALNLWQTEAPCFFPDGAPAYTVPLDGGMLHVMPTQWCDTPYFWDDTQRPHWLPDHQAALEARLARDPELVHVVCTHGEVLPAPPAQTGMRDPYHAPPEAYVEQVLAPARRYPQLRCVLGGHNHINTYRLIGATHVATASAFTETPFEFKVVEVTAGSLAMTTVALWPEVGFPAAYDWERTFVQGRACDRGFSVTF
jgi:DNA repair exonuclease SbcCD nuclease subunit